MAGLTRPIMQSMPDTRQQSFEEIYGPPENFLEIEVWPPFEHVIYLRRRACMPLSNDKGCEELIEIVLLSSITSFASVATHHATQ